MSEIERIAQGADFIVNGYSFFCQASMVRVLNLNNPASAAVLSRNGDVLETSMRKQWFLPKLPHFPCFLRNSRKRRNQPFLIFRKDARLSTGRLPPSAETNEKLPALFPL